MRVRVCAILVILIIGISGCGKDEEKEDNIFKSNIVEMETDRETLFPSEVNKNISDELEVNAKVNIPENFSGFLKQYQITQKNFDEQLVLEALEINETEMENPTQGTFFNEKMNLSIGECLAFATKKGMDYRKLAIPEFCTKEKELSFASIEQATEQVFDFLQSALQISSLEVNGFYTFDSESEKVREKKISEEEGYQVDIKTGKTNSEKILDGKEGGYYFEFVQIIDDIPLYQFDREKDGIIIPGFRVNCIYTQEGIEYLEASKPYEIVKAEKDIPILNVNAVIDLLCKKLDNVIITGKLEVTGMELIYVPTEETVLMPVWKIDIQDGEEEFLVYFDAETGKELLF